MSIYADEGTAAHFVLEQCLRNKYEFGFETPARDYLNAEVEVKDEPHARLSPSGAKRWMTCHGSVAMQEALPEPAEGPPGPRTITVELDYVDAVQTILDYVAVRVAEIGADTGQPVQVIAERKVSPQGSLGTDACDGTVDITLVAGDFIEIIDAKMGKGVPVSVNDPQCDLYLLGTLDEDLAIELKRARITIAQPRCDKVEPRIRSRDIVIKDWYLPFRYKVLAHIQAIDSGDMTMVASEDGCRFCSARGRCEHHIHWAMASAGVAEELPETAGELFRKSAAYAACEPYMLTGEQMRGILDSADILKGAITAVEAHAAQMIMIGAAPPEVTNAYKLVEGRSNRSWASEETETEKGLKRIKVDDPDTGKRRGLGKKDLLETKLKSVATVEKLLKSYGIGTKDARFDAFKRLYAKPPGKPTLAPVSDKRPSVVSSQTDAETFATDLAPPPVPEK